MMGLSHRQHAPQCSFLGRVPFVCFEPWWCTKRLYLVICYLQEIPTDPKPSLFTEIALDSSRLGYDSQ